MTAALQITTALLSTPVCMQWSTAQMPAVYRPTPPSAALAHSITALWVELHRELKAEAWRKRYTGWRTDAALAAAMRQDLIGVRDNLAAGAVTPPGGIPPQPVRTSKVEAQQPAPAPAKREVPKEDLITTRERGPMMGHLNRGGVPDNSQSRSAFYTWLTAGFAGGQVPPGTLTNELSKSEAHWITAELSHYETDVLINIVGNFVKGVPYAPRK